MLICYSKFLKNYRNLIWDKIKMTYVLKHKYLVFTLKAHLQSKEVII